MPERFGGCPLCGLVGGHPDDVRVLAERPAALAILSRYQLRVGHVLVVARRHVETWTELAWDDGLDMQRLAWEAARAIERAFRPVRVYAATLGATNKESPTTFPHLHVHVVPIYDGDDRDKPANVFTWAHGLEIPSSDEADARARALRDAWAEASKDR